MEMDVTFHLFMDRGYLFFKIIPVETNVTDRHINYQIRMLEGKEARIGSVSIRGNTKTNDYVFLEKFEPSLGTSLIKRIL